MKQTNSYKKTQEVYEGCQESKSDSRLCLSELMSDAGDRVFGHKLSQLIGDHRRMIASPGSPSTRSSKSLVIPNSNKSTAKNTNSLTEAAERWIALRYRRSRKLNIEDTDPDKRDVDGGYAWIILVVIFLINASTFGTARAYGLIFDKVARVVEQNRSNAALPFTIMGAIENMGGPLTSYLLGRTDSWRVTVFAGCCLILFAHLIAAAFAESLLGQVLSMGLMCGLGLSLVTISFFQINNAYFVRYRSRAFGLGLTGAVFGTLYISPICRYVLDEHGISACYLALSLILLPNVPLSLLLKPKTIFKNDHKEHQIKHKPIDEAYDYLNADLQSMSSSHKSVDVYSVSGDLEQRCREKEEQQKQQVGLWQSIKLVIKTPMFHLIWPTQLLFCWFNFVVGMILVDFGTDREFSSAHVSQLIPIWALGQLVGRLVLGSLVDLKLVSYEMFAVISFISISLATCILNNLHYDCIVIPIVVVILSMFISNLYILFNGLVVKHMDKSLTAPSIGISSFTGSFFLLPRAYVIGYYRDTFGNYDAMLSMFTYVSFVAALVWLVVPTLGSHLRRIWISRYSGNGLGGKLTICDFPRASRNQSHHNLVDTPDLVNNCA